MFHRYEITGEIPAKKNAWHRSRHGVYLDPKVKADIDALLWQLKGQKPKLAGDCRVWIIIYAKSQRTDLDAKITTIFDLLQTAEIVLNDRQIKQCEAIQIKVGDKPKTEIKISLI